MCVLMVQSRSSDDEDGASGDGGADYQLDMMRCLREVNVDNNTVGWCAHHFCHRMNLM
jgi:hypothetical protein